MTKYETLNTALEAFIAQNADQDGNVRYFCLWLAKHGYVLIDEKEAVSREHTKMFRDLVLDRSEALAQAALNFLCDWNQDGDPGECISEAEALEKLDDAVKRLQELSKLTPYAG